MDLSVRRIARECLNLTGTVSVRKDVIIRDPEPPNFLRAELSSFAEPVANQRLPPICGSARWAREQSILRGQTTPTMKTAFASLSRQEDRVRRQCRDQNLRGCQQNERVH